MIVSRSIPAPPPEVNLANYLILNYDPLRPSDSVVLTKVSNTRNLYIKNDLSHQEHENLCSIKEGKAIRPNAPTARLITTNALFLKSSTALPPRFRRAGWDL